MLNKLKLSLKEGQVQPESVPEENCFYENKDEGEVDEEEVGELAGEQRFVINVPFVNPLHSNYRIMKHKEPDELETLRIPLERPLRLYCDSRNVSRDRFESVPNYSAMSRMTLHGNAFNASRADISRSNTPVQNDAS